MKNRECDALRNFHFVASAIVASKSMLFPRLLPLPRSFHLRECLDLTTVESFLFFWQ